MRSIAVRVLVVCAVAVSFVNVSPFPFPAPVLVADIPDDVTIAPGFPQPPVNAIQYFDDYSWRIFAALTWSADPMQRGVADRTKTILDDAGPRVWERWKAMYEVFVDPPGTRPGDWTVEQPTDGFCAGLPAGRRIVMSRHVAELNQGGMLASHPMGPLVASNGTYIQYEIRINEVAFNHIRDHRLYKRSVIGSVTTPFPTGSIAVKAAWRELDAADDPARFFHVQGMVLDTVTKQCVTKTMGLVALHIAQKTPTRPQWIWSTFEHVDMLTNGGPFAIQAADPVGVPVEPATPCDPGSPALSNLMITGPPAITTSVPASPPPTPIARLVPIASCTAWTDHLYRGALGDAARVAGRPVPVTANYRLVMTQWPTTPFDPFNVPNSLFRSNPFPRYDRPRTNAANVAVETYVQKGSSCMNCHNAAKTEFIWFPEIRALPRQDKAREDSIKRLRATSYRR
jgi:hypothetical protein